MLLLDEKEVRPKQGPHIKLKLPRIRPSILDADLESEPWIDECPCSQTLVLFLHNHPIAMIAGTPLEHAALNTRLHEMRHRYPRGTF